MNRVHKICCAITLAVSAGGLQAQTASPAPQRAIEGYYPDIDPPSTMTRAQVMADVEAARMAGALGFDHDGELPAYPASLGGDESPVQFASDRERGN